MHMGNHLDKVTRHLILEDHTIKDQLEIQSPGQVLSHLDLSNIELSWTCCKNIGEFLITSEALK